MDNFFGMDFETGYLLFAYDFPQTGGVYIIYTLDGWLDIGKARDLKDTLETHPQTRDWIKKAQGNDIYVAFQLDESVQSRVDKQRYLKSKINQKVLVFNELPSKSSEPKT